MLTNNDIKLWIELFCEIKARKLYSVIPFVCHCKHSNTMLCCTSSQSWVTPVHSACRRWPTQMGDTLNIWIRILTEVNRMFGCKQQWHDVKPRVLFNYTHMVLLSYGNIKYSTHDSWDQMEDIFTQASFLANIHSFRRIYFNLVPNVQTKSAIILTMARVCKDWILLTLPVRWTADKELITED